MTVDQGAVHTFMAPTEGTVKLSGSGAVKSGAFPNLRAPERFSFPPIVNEQWKSVATRHRAAETTANDESAGCKHLGMSTFEFHDRLVNGALRMHGPVDFCEPGR